MKRARRWVRYQCARAAIATLSRAPRRPALVIFERLGSLAYRLMPGQRALVSAQIDHVYGARAATWRRETARRAFIELAAGAVDVARLCRGDRRALLDVVDLPPGERLRPLTSGCGAIAIGGHYGAWELVPPVLSALGAEVTTLVRPLREMRLDRLVTRLRVAHGVEILDRHEDARRMMRVLRAGRTLAIAADQTPRGRTVTGELLGLPARLPAGPAALAIAARVPLVPVAIRRVGMRHVMLVSEPIVPPGERTRAAVATMMRCYAAVLGEWIEAAPAQWAWFHERWKDDPHELSGGAAGDVADGGEHARVLDVV